MSLGAICGLIYNLHSITTTYLSYPTNINIKVEHRTELSFPSVTICNMSPVKRSLWTNKFGSVLEPAAPVSSRKRRRKRAGKTSFYAVYVLFTRLYCSSTQTACRVFATIIKTRKHSDRQCTSLPDRHLEFCPKSYFMPLLLQITDKFAENKTS